MKTLPTLVLFCFASFAHAIDCGTTGVRTLGLGTSGTLSLSGATDRSFNAFELAFSDQVGSELWISPHNTAGPVLRAHRLFLYADTGMEWEANGGLFEVSAYMQDTSTFIPIHFYYQLVAHADSSNTVDLMQWQDYSSVPLTSVSYRGQFSIGETTRRSTLTVKPVTDGTINGTTTVNGSTTVVGSNTEFQRELGIGDRISVSSAPSTYATVTAIANDTSLTVSSALGDGTNQTINRKASILRLDDATGAQKLLVQDNGAIQVGTAPGITASGSSCTITAITNGIITGATCVP